MLLRPRILLWVKTAFPFLTDKLEIVEIPRPPVLLEGAKTTPSPIPRFEPSVAAAHGKLYVFGGFDHVSFTASRRCDSFDPASGAWTELAPIPAAVTHAGTAVAGDEVWIAGGFSGNHPGPVTSAVWRYHLVRNSWTPGPLLPQARGGGGLAFVNGELHFFGGLLADRQTDARDHWSLSLSDASLEWKPRAPLAAGRNHFSTAVVGDRVHLIGGQHGHDPIFEDIPAHEVYDAATDAWSQAAPLLRPRSHAEPGTFVHNGRIFVAGGRSNTIPVLHDFHAYDPATNRWEVLPGLPEPLRAPVVRILGDSIYAGLGGATLTGLTPIQDWWKFPLSQLVASR